MVTRNDVTNLNDSTLSLPEKFILWMEFFFYFVGTNFSDFSYLIFSLGIKQFERLLAAAWKILVFIGVKIQGNEYPLSFLFIWIVLKSVR